MERHNLGPLLALIGIFGGGFLWFILCGLRFDYLVQNVFHGDPGEAIWALDPLFTILAALPSIVLLLVGFVLSLFPYIINRNYVEFDEVRSLRAANLFYLGEIFIVLTAVVSFASSLGILSLASEITWISAHIMLLIAITCSVHLFLILHQNIRQVSQVPQVSILSKITIVLLCIEFIALTIAIGFFQLYVWSFIRLTAIFVISSGILGVFLFFSQIMRN